MRIGVEIDSGNYTFDASAKTITFTGITGLSLESFSLITNVNQGDNIVIYQFQKLGKGATFAADVLTLEYDTTLMSDTDRLKINASVTSEQITQGVYIPAIVILKESVIATTSGDTIIHTPAVGKKIRLFSFGYSASGTVAVGNIRVRWRFGAGSYLDTQYLTGNQAFTKTPGNGKFCYEGAVDEELIINLDSLATIAMNIDYEEV